MPLKRIIDFEIKRVFGWRYIIVIMVFLMASGYFLQYGIGEYKYNVSEKNNFLEFERQKYQSFFKASVYGNYGLRLLFEPSPLMAFFASGPVPGGMTAFLDGSERMKIYQPLKGKSGFVMISSAFMTFAGFILLFGNAMFLLYGFTGSKDHEWLKFLESYANKREKLFFSLLISKTFILLLLCLVLFVLCMILFIINGVTVNIGQVSIILMCAFFMLFCFLVCGLIAGTLKNRFWGWASMGATWFLLAFFIPVLIFHFTYNRAGSIISSHKMEIKKQKTFFKYELDSFKKEGTFNDLKKGTEKEMQMFLYFWDNGFKKAMEYEKGILDEMKENTSFFQNFSALFPSSFFISVNIEVSSRGFSNLIGFNEYTQKKKKEFIWYIAQNHIFYNKKVFPAFIKDNENIYHGKSQLPGNFNFGLSVTIIWIIVLLVLYWFMFNRMLDRAQDTQRVYNPDELKKNKTNVIFTLDKGILPQLIKKLRLLNISFLSVPSPPDLPGDTTIKNLLSLFGLAVPETLKEIAGKYVYTLEPDQKGKVLMEITGSLKADIFIFNNFLAGLSDAIINPFASTLKLLKKGRKIVYFTNSLLINAIIGDGEKRFDDEIIPF